MAHCYISKWSMITLHCCPAVMAGLVHTCSSLLSDMWQKYSDFKRWPWVTEAVEWAVCTPGHVCHSHISVQCDISEMKFNFCTFWSDLTFVDWTQELRKVRVTGCIVLNFQITEHLVWTGIWWWQLDWNVNG